MGRRLGGIHLGLFAKVRSGGLYGLGFTLYLQRRRLLPVDPG